MTSKSTREMAIWSRFVEAHGEHSCSDLVRLTRAAEVSSIHQLGFSLGHIKN